MLRGAAWGAVAAASSVIALSPAGGAAATISVTTTGDEFGGPGGSGCALREAVQAANDDQAFGGCRRRGRGSADTIVLRAGRVYDLTLPGVEDANAGGDLDLEGGTRVDVRGEGKATIDGGFIDRVFEVLRFARLSASRLVIQNGRAQNATLSRGGGGIHVRRRGTLALRSSVITENGTAGPIIGCVCGGGISAVGNMMLRRVTMTYNATQGTGGGVASFGGRLLVLKSTIRSNTAGGSGGIEADADRGPVRIDGSTIANNHATSDDGGVAGVAIEAVGDSAQLTNDTISGNQSDGHTGGILVVDFFDPGSIELNALTITANVANADSDAGTNPHGGGLVAISGQDFGVVQNSIIAGNSDNSPAPVAPDCYGLDTGDLEDTPRHNLVTPTGGCSTGGTNVVANEPLLGLLDANGGPTFTHALMPGSPAIGKAGRKTAPKRDQRGRTRDRRPDIGAFERGA